MLPLTTNQTIVNENFIDNHTYITGNGKAITHLVNGQAGNLVSFNLFRYLLFENIFRTITAGVRLTHPRNHTRLWPFTASPG